MKLMLADWIKETFEFQVFEGVEGAFLPYWSVPRGCDH